MRQKYVYPLEILQSNIHIHCCEVLLGNKEFIKISSQLCAKINFLKGF